MKVKLSLLTVPVLLVLLGTLALGGCGDDYDCTEAEFERISSEEEFNKWMNACEDRLR